ncbi:hypothetical protein GMLC_20900 [Geomonas limicola]|uniref:Uncharacterized protein n=1 Tax=Geomonas limicola TaxID=2740186 RepID=A0A6V8N7N9_9BACT|nr:TIGR00180 family glycosyltransferase [Geomonas limicola]GFO68511.1 hypothetical protein GMLC_20900 [Geomonas limicola]
MLSSELTIIIPTFKRPDYMIRTIRYYHDNGFKGHLLVGDSSDAATRRRMIAFLEEHRFPRVQYLNCEHQGVLEVLALFMPQVTTKYVACCGDDDYLVPSSIERCIDFLEHNPDYSCAGGRMITYTLTGYDKGTDTHEGPVTNFWEYYIPSIEQETADERLAYYSIHNPLITYSIFRTETRAVPFRFQHLPNLDNSLLGELVPNFCTLIYGKLKSFDHLHSFRQKGAQHLTNPNLIEGRSPEHIDWILTPTFAECYQYYRELGTRILAETTGMTEQAAEKIVIRHFQASCAAHLLFPAFNVYREHPPWHAEHEELRRCLRSLVGEFDRTLPPGGAHQEESEPAADRPRLLLVTPRWEGGMPGGGTSQASWTQVEALLECPEYDACILYTDQLWHDFGLSADTAFAAAMQAGPFDAVVISSQLEVNPVKPSTLAFLAHSGIPVALTWDTPENQALAQYYRQAECRVHLVPEPKPGNRLELWPPLPAHTFHDPGLERDLGILCLGEPLGSPQALADLRPLVAAQVEVQGIRDWRFDYFMRQGRSLEEACNFQSSLFDEQYYLTAHPVTLPEGMDALTHYQEVGWRLDYNPNPLFDTAYYRSLYPDAQAPGCNPLWYYLNAPLEWCHTPHPAFDGFYYLATYPDAGQSGLHPLDHYLKLGVAQGRRSCPPLVGSELAAQLKRSRLALSLRGAAGPQDAARAALQALSCGALLLEPEESPLARWFTPMVDYVPYRDADDLVAKVQHYLEHEEERAAIARSGSRKAATQFSGTAFWHALCSHLWQRTSTLREA